MKTRTLKQLLVFLLSAVLLVSLCGCNLSEMQQNNDYVSSVKNLVNDCINQNRVLKTQDETFNCHEPEKAKEYISTMDSLSTAFQKLQQLQPTGEFADYQAKIAESGASALSSITRIRTLVAYAAEHEDDTLYQNDKEELFSEYNASCEALRSLSSEVQTYWRNA